MGRPKSKPEEAATERDTAPATETPVVTVMERPRYIMPHQKQPERVAAVSAPFVNRYPQIRGGVCEFCGVLDGHQPSEYQYKLCPHYRGMTLRCTYCPREKVTSEGSSTIEVIRNSTFNVADHPSDPNQLVIWCDSYDCSRKHLARFQVNA